MKDIDAVSAEQKISIEIGTSHFQVVVEDDGLAKELLPSLSNWVVDEPRNPGFRIVRPSKDGGLWVALGADGAPIIRSRNTNIVMTVLRRHLDALIGATTRAWPSRYGLRVVLGARGAALVNPLLLKSQPVIERQFTRNTLQIVDSPYADIDVQPRAVTVVPVPRSGFSNDDLEIPGHAANLSGEVDVRALLWIGALGSPEPSIAQVAHALAGSARSGTREQRIDQALDLATRIDVVLVDAGQRSSVVKTAARVLR